jgi:hypothetical protein
MSHGVTSIYDELCAWKRRFGRAFDSRSRPLFKASTGPDEFFRTMLKSDTTRDCSFDARDLRTVRTMKKTLGDAANRSEILGRLRKVRPDSPRQWGRMTPHQMIRHLRESFLSVMGEGEVVLAKVPLPRGLMRWLALDFPRPWPQGVPTMPEVDQVLKAAPEETRFPADVAALQELVERISGGGTAWRPHPFFGVMTDAQWMRWGWLHMDHHFRQFGV